MAKVCRLPQKSRQIANNCVRTRHLNGHVRRVRSRLCVGFFLVLHLFGGFFYASNECDVLPLQEVDGVYSKIRCAPFLTCFVRPLQEVNGTYSKCNFPLPHVFPPPPFPLEREPTASAPRGATLSTRIDKYRPLVMSLVRGRKKSQLVRSLVLYIKLGVRFLAALRLALRTSTYRV